MICTLPSEQLSTPFVVCCVVTRSTLKPIDAFKKESRQESHELPIIN